ncbi:hypothetical protein SAY86_011449 [Trapa natans]|uniref:RNA helicase n=1 Tax=Trapa natans TaxID=22666 RepID=A0AAN7LKA6_TRANT|nr:hypothetical protein SAY86_011449 [Trapa natans]
MTGQRNVGSVPRAAVVSIALDEILAMTTSEASLGPRYAPDDPTLPKPWKGLIDGSTGNLYYWNPETNVTQYEKPTALPPPLHQGHPSANLAGNGMLAQSGQHMNQPVQGLQGSQLQQQHRQSTSEQQSAQGIHATVQQGSQMDQSGSQQVSHLVPPGSYMPNQYSMQHPSHHMYQQTGQQLHRQLQKHMGSQVPQQQLVHQVLQEAALQDPLQLGQKMGQSPVNQILNQQPQQLGYQQNVPVPKQDILPQTQNSSHAQPSSGQQHRTGFPKVEQPEISPSQPQKGGSSSTPNFQGGPNSVMTPSGMHPNPAKQFVGYQGNIQQATSVAQFHQTGPDMGNKQHFPRFQNPMDPSMMNSHQSSTPTTGLRMGPEDNFHGRSGNEHYFGTSKEGPIPNTQQPRLAPISMARNQSGMVGPGSVPFQNAPHGPADGLNALTEQGVQSMHGHGTGPQPFTNNAPLKCPFAGPLGLHLTPAQAYCQQHEVTATGDNIPSPFMTFEATGFPPEILREIYSADFTAPTPIQAQTWPIALQGRDIVAIAKTGSGKTLGYLMPAFMLVRMRRTNPQKGPAALVLSPTRELATQIQEEAIKFGRSSRISCTCLYGGAPKGPQLKELDRGADIVVATPGRLNDILESKQIDLQQVALLVLDEADRMLDMGFEPQIRKIVNEIPRRRQTLMYTATWPKEVRKIASDLLVNPVQVNIGNADELVANKSITQFVEVVPQMEKQRRLEQILRSQERGSKVIIFCSTKRLCDQLARGIRRNFGAVAIHGDKSQGERDWVLNQFRTGKSPILVATDVAARGLDIKDIRVVVNYDFPTGVEDYVHRIGRTGRAGATGVSYTFFSEQDYKYAPDLIKVLEGANQHVPPEIREMASRAGPGFVRDQARINRFDSSGVSRWDSGGQGGMRDSRFGGRGEMRDGGRGGMRDGGFGGRGGGRDGGFRGRGGRVDSFPGRGFRLPGPLDHRFNSIPGCGGGGGGRGQGRGGRLDDRRDGPDRGRGRNYSKSPDMVRTWVGYSRSRSRSSSWSRSRSPSRSWSRSRSRSRSWSRGRSHSYGRSPRLGRNRSCSYERPLRARVSGFDAPLVASSAPPEPLELHDSVPATVEVADHLLAADAIDDSTDQVEQLASEF